MISAKIALVTAIIAVIMSTSGAIKCHRCSSHIDEKCADIDPSNNDTLIECEQEDAFCRKTVQHLIEEDIKRITRECGWIKFEDHPGNYCMTSDTNFKKEKSCQCFTDGCNAGDRVKAVNVLFLLSVFLIISLSGC